MLKLLVIEDHALVREGLVQALLQLGDEVVVEEAADCEAGCALLGNGEDFDLVLLDLALPGVDGLTCLGLYRQRYPALPVVIVSAYDDAHTVNRALQAGAAGFVPKAYSGDRLLDALRKVLDGTIYVPEQTLPTTGVVGPAAQQSGQGISAAAAGLTGRQTDVLGLMVKGCSNREIAELLGLSEGTVKIHITAIFKALGVNSRTQALVAVADKGIHL
ncbi:MAG: response regulator transcription factor [Rhodocyclaceae bacterium]|nr:response regulator transcription factor [Rhodocyclaceae bacterium]